jgi:putative lipoic acid-binding regulatory protein
MDADWLHSFKTKLDQHHSWPSLYIFKFIVPKEKVNELKNLFPQHQVTEKASSQGRYIGVTMQIMAPSSNSIIEIYELASQIEGLISL